MSTCDDVGSDVHALIKELVIRRVQHRSETYSNESQHLAEGTEVARLRRRFSFVLQQALSFRTRHHLCRQGVALASTRRPHSQDPASVQAHGTGGVTGSEGQEGANGSGVALASTRRPHSQGPASIQAHRTGGVTGSEGQEGANGSGAGLESGGGGGDGNGDVNGHGDGDGTGAGTGGEVNEGAQDGNGDGAETGTGTGTGLGTRRRTPDGNGDGDGDGSGDCSGDRNGDDDNGSENRIGEGGREAKKRKKPQNSCRRRAGNGGDTGGGKRKKCRKERVGSVAANPDNLGSNKEVGGGAEGAQGSSKICTSRESVSPLSRLIKGFCNKYH